MRERPSVYLEEKCAALGMAFDFFLAREGTYLSSVNERLLSFLTQIDFWEWEMDNLLYSFATFSERSEAWTFEKGLVEALRTRGIFVQPQLYKALKERRQGRKQTVRVVAPHAALAAVIEKWNDLLSLCEERVLLPREELCEAAAGGAQLLVDLTRYRKGLTPLAD